jgi:hypothetical protein
MSIKINKNYLYLKNEYLRFFIIKKFVKRIHMIILNVIQFLVLLIN